MKIPINGFVYWNYSPLVFDCIEEISSPEKVEGRFSFSVESPSIKLRSIPRSTKKEARDDFKKLIRSLKHAKKSYVRYMCDKRY